MRRYLDEKRIRKLYIGKYVYKKAERKTDRYRRGKQK